MNWNQICRTGLAALACALSIGAQAATSNGVTATLATDRHALGKSDDVIVTVTITNTSSSPQYVLKWHTPFGEIEESLFRVTRDGVPVPYLGAHYKRQSPVATDYYLLKPGASHSMKVELSSMYDMSITGDYQVSYDARSLSLFSSELAGKGAVPREIGEITSAPLTIWIDGAQPRGTMPKGATIDELRAAQGNSLAFSKCTASQQATVAQALSAGSAMASDGDAYMARGAIGSRYVKWFGANDAARVNTIKAHYVALKDAFANKPVTVDCGCKKTYYAYVYPTQPYVIYVCKAFWTAPMTGTDSKGGTLVHEMSHFNVVASTDDWVYGQSGAASLAISDPSKAIDNADSHEYFGENTPTLQ
ncbi:MAG: M35 family metallo-endopeptidase [Pseudomonadota bacterium]|nr:M35 family metallo-endopeptidase [Pseudomonadota bacterium]